MTDGLARRAGKHTRRPSTYEPNVMTCDGTLQPMSQGAVQAFPQSAGRPALAVIDAALTQKIEASTALLRQAVSDFGRVVYANSLGAEAVVLTDLICTE